MTSFSICFLLVLVVATSRSLAGAATPGVTPAAPAIAEAARAANDDVLARGSGFMVRRSDLAEEQRVHLDEVREMERAGLPRSRIDWWALNSLINREVVLAHATREDRAGAEAKFHADFGAHKVRVKISDVAFEEGLARQLAEWQLSRARWQARAIDGYVVQHVCEREIAATITPEEMTRYYEARLPNFEMPEKVRAHYILLSTVDRQTGLRLSPAECASKRALLEEILRRARAGENFAVLEMRFSEAAPPKDGEAARLFARGQNPTEFDRAVFALRPGEISDIIETDSGCQLVQVREKIPARRLALAEVADRVRLAIVFERTAQHVARLKAEAKIQIVEPSLRAESDHAVRESSMP